MFFSPMMVSHVSLGMSVLFYHLWLNATGKKQLNGVTQFCINLFHREEYFHVLLLVWLCLNQTSVLQPWLI